MANKNKEYQKLPGSKRGFLVGKHTLWQGQDHLLQIFCRMGVEEYKRFYFSDVQAIVTHKTDVGKVQNAILGCFILFLAWPAFVFEGEWSISFAAAAGVLLILLFINLTRGSTCETRLMTAVQTEKIHSLSRLKNAVKVMDRIKPYIQNIQGVITPEGMARGPARSIDNKTNVARSQPKNHSKTILKHEKGRMHMILFGLLLLQGLQAAGGFFSNHVILTLLGSVTSICMGIFVIIALVKQHNSDMPVSLRSITWVSLGYVGIGFIAGYAVSFTFAFKNPNIAYNQWELLKSISTLSPWESPLILGFNIFTVCGALFLGIPGLLMLKKSKKSKKKVTAAKSNRPLFSGAPIPG